MKKNVYIGLDDGYAETKVVLSSGVCFRIPSQAKAGEMSQIAINGSGHTVFPYKTQDGNYIIGDITETDSTAFDDYPMSALNRVIVMHALRLAGVEQDAQVFVCTGLPIKRFYLAGSINKNLIKQKTANLLKNDVVSLDGEGLPKIFKHEVVSEGIAAWMDVVLYRDESGKIVVNKEQAAKRMAIIDIGGRTTDIAVIQNGNLDINRSSTINVGMLAVQEMVKEAIIAKFELSPSIEHLNTALTEKRIKLWGKWEPVADLVIAAQKTILARIESECKRCIGNGADLDQVVFVGGTVVEVEALLNGWFKNQYIGFEPGYANARGMQKYAEMIMNAETKTATK
ncbi:StbA protein [compost metagenome]